MSSIYHQRQHLIELPGSPRRRCRQCWSRPLLLAFSSGRNVSGPPSRIVVLVFFNVLETTCEMVKRISCFFEEGNEMVSKCCEKKCKSLQFFGEFMIGISSRSWPRCRHSVRVDVVGGGGASRTPESQVARVHSGRATTCPTTRLPRLVYSAP